MFEHFMIRLLFILLCFSIKSFAVQNEVCNKDQYVVSGSDLSFTCTNEGYITYAEVNINGRECMFINTNYEIVEDTKNCDKSLQNRISLQQECSTNSNCHSNSYTFRVTNVQIEGKSLLWCFIYYLHYNILPFADLCMNNFNFIYLEDSGVWNFSVGSGRSIRGSQQSKIYVDIFKSGANARFYASKESTEGCPIPAGKYMIMNMYIY